MNEAPAVVRPQAIPSLDRLFSALLQCLHCRQRRMSDIRTGEYFVLRREGTVNFSCPQCGAWTAHRLIRLAP